jgi:hypothetical protein
VVVFATPPFALVNAILLKLTPRMRLDGSGSRPTFRNRAALSSGTSTAHHRKRPALSGRAAGSHLVLSGLRLGFYLHPVGTGRE